MMQGASEYGAFIPNWETLFVDLQRTPADRLLDPGEAVLPALRALQAADQCFPHSKYHLRDRK